MSTVLGLPLPLPAPGLASLLPGTRLGTREAGPEIGVIRATAAVSEQQGRPGAGASRRGDRADLEPRDERKEQPAGERQVARPAAADYRPAAFAGAFLAQLLSQDESEGGSGGRFAALQSGGRQAELGSEAYRRAGGEPPAYSEAPSLFRIAV